ncbi:MAG: potassium transporter KefB [Methanosarcinales archaeon]|nr:potassium transporter KefB [Methanosarcinales archaeon]
MELLLLRDIVVIFGLSIFVLFLFHRLRAPTIVGFLLTGVLAGPQVLGLVHAGEEVKALAEIGVILLLFTVGIEISLKDLIQLKKYVLLGGSFQVLLTILAVYSLASRLGIPTGEAILLGFLVSLSSTAIVLRVIQSRAEFDSLHGRTTLGILIFQDVVIVPMMLLTSMLPGASGGISDPPLQIVLKAAAIIILVVAGAKYIVPTILFQVARTRDRELFLLAVITICLAVAWGTAMAGLSLGLGAFLAGLIISESEYSHQAFGNVLPLKDAFTSFFFVSIGMLLDLDLLFQNPGFIVLLALGVLILKALVAGLAILFLGLPLRIAVLVGLSLSQIGEFSFILSSVGLESGLLSVPHYQLFLDVTVLTMGATSFIMAVAPGVADRVMTLPLPGRILKRKQHHLPAREARDLESHLIIVGYGVNGRNLAQAVRSAGIPYVIIETDPEIVLEVRKSGLPIEYGDATQEMVLHQAGIKKARIMVIAISDPYSTRRIVSTSRLLNPDLYIVARTRYLKEVQALTEAGADVVIPEEYETSVEIFARVLEQYLVSPESINQLVEEIRQDGYQMFRGLSTQPVCDLHLELEDVELKSFRVEKGSPLDGKTFVPDRFPGVDVLAVKRNSDTLTHSRDLVLREGDLVVLMGPHEEMPVLKEMFEGRKA